MAIEVDGKTYRNLPEQVEENANQIEDLKAQFSTLGTIMRYKGSVATYADLPTEDLQIGDVWNVLDTGSNYAWDGEEWDEIGSTVDLSGLVTLDTGQTITGEKTFTGNLRSNGRTYFAGANISSNVVPYATNSYDLGTSTYTWKDLYLSGVITVNNTEARGIKFGTSSANGGAIGVGAGGLYMVSNNGIVGINSSVKPYLDATYDLGTSASWRWKDLYLSGIAYINTWRLFQNGAYFVMNSNGADLYYFGSSYICPKNNNSQSLGTQNFKWKDIFVAGNLSDGTNSVTVAQLAKNILYKHTIVTDVVTIEIITNDNTALTSINDIESLFDNSIRASYITGGRKFRIETILSGYIYYVSGVSITDHSIGNIISDTVTQY